MLSAPIKTAEENLTRLEEAKKTREGLIHRNETPQQAEWSDMFRGIEVSNFAVVDVAKVQMFFFTLIIVASYAVQIWLLLGNQQTLTGSEVDFPPFDDSMAALLGLSHAGYLAVRTTS